GPVAPPRHAGRGRGRADRARVRAARIPAAAQERRGHPRDARPGRVEGARLPPDQRRRGVRQLPAPQARTARQASPDPHRPEDRLLPAGGRAVRLSIRWRLTLCNALALAVVLLGFAALVYSLLTRALYQQWDRRLLAGWQHLEQDERLAGDRDGRLRY